MSDISLTVLDDMRLLISPQEIARDSEHNAALFKITAQPTALDQYTCRAEVETAAGTTYRVVTNGEFALTNDIAVHGRGRLQLSYSDGVDVMRKTTMAPFHVSGSLNAVDESAPGFGDGLAQLQGACFASADLVGLTLNFYNLSGQLVGTVTSPAGGVEEVPTANGAYARIRTASGADWMDFNTLRVASLDSPQFAGAPTAPTAGAGVNSAQIATTEWIQNQFAVRDYLPRSGGQMTGPLVTTPGLSATNPGLAIGDNSTGFYRPSAGLLNSAVSGVNVTQFMPTICAFFVPINVGNNVIQAVGDPGQPTDGLNLRSGDTRYLQQTVADARYLPSAGGMMVGDLRMLSASGPDAEIAIYLGGRDARIYWGNAIVMRRGGVGESVYIENNNGANRSEVITQLMGDARYLQQPAADTRYLQLTAGGIVAGPLQVLQTPFLATDAANKGYVDNAVAGVVAPTALRTIAYTPNEIVISGAATTFLDVNFPMPATGLRNILVTVNPIFASNDPPGATTWQVIYATPLILLESPVVAYKLGADPTGFIRAPAQFTAAVDATSGSIRVLLSARLSGAGSGLIQVGVGGTIAPNMRTIVTVQDLGPA